MLSWFSGSKPFQQELDVEQLRNHFILIIGPAGSGKTTLAQSLCTTFEQDDKLKSQWFGDSSIWHNIVQIPDEEKVLLYFDHYRKIETVCESETLRQIVQNNKEKRNCTIIMCTPTLPEFPDTEIFPDFVFVTGNSTYQPSCAVWDAFYQNNCTQQEFLTAGSELKDWTWLWTNTFTPAISGTYCLKLGSSKETQENDEQTTPE